MSLVSDKKNMLHTVGSGVYGNKEVKGGFTSEGQSCRKCRFGVHENSDVCK
jgi:hypothetical protein